MSLNSRTPVDRQRRGGAHAVSSVGPLAVLLVLGALAGDGAAQDRPVTGVVTDIDTRQPIAGASVVVRVGETVHSESTTDEAGRFEVAGPGGVGSALHVIAVGYAPSDPVWLRPNAFGGRSFRIRLESLDASGNRREPTYVFGRVTDAETGRGLAGVNVRVDGRDLGALSGGEGRFLLKEVPVGRVRLNADFLGYESRSFDLETSNGTALELDFQLTTEPIELEGITVTARSRAMVRKLAPVYERLIRDMGGTFIAREEIERRPGDVAQLLYAVPGIRIQKGLGGWYAVSFPRRQCTPSVFVDGIRVYKPGDPGNEFLAMSGADVEVIEVYKGAGTLPPEYNDPYTVCAIGIWTRRGG